MLENYVNRLMERVLDEVNELPSTASQLQVYSKKAELYSLAIKNLNNHIINYDFRSLENEIHFFKAIKPKILAEQHYCYSKAKLLQQCNYQSKDSRDQLLIDTLADIDSFFKVNQKYVTYVELNQGHKDNRYYVRLSTRKSFNLDYNLVDKDVRFTSEKGHLLGKIHSKRKLSRYLQRILHLEPLHDMSKGLQVMGTLNYSGTTTELVELIYAIKEAGLVKDNVARICEVIGEAMGVKNLKPYKVWQKIKERKMGHTRLLTKLEKSLSKRIRQEIEA